MKGLGFSGFFLFSFFLIFFFYLRPGLQKTRDGEETRQENDVCLSLCLCLRYLTRLPWKKGKKTDAVIYCCLIVDLVVLALRTRRARRRRGAGWRSRKGVCSECTGEGRREERRMTGGGGDDLWIISF